MTVATRPKLFALILAASASLGGVAAIKVATAPAERAKRIREPAPRHMCGHAISAWMAEQDRLDALED
jgi:hypothetical protein